MKQSTIKNKISIKGQGLHSGKEVTMVLLPAAENTGIIFKRVDIENPSESIIKASFDNVNFTTLCTQVSNEHKVSVATIEHFMAALASLKIDNLMVEIDSDEVPILDGSSIEYIKAIKKVGILEQNAKKNIIKILKTVSIVDDNWSIKIEPSDDFVIDATINFSQSSVIGKQRFVYEASKTNFVKEVSKARTFGFMKDVEVLKSKGLGKGANLNNTIVVEDNKVINSKGLRYKKEFVIHKVLDAIGDLYLGGCFIKGKVTAYKSGHKSNNLLLREIFKDSSNYAVESNDNVDNVSYDLYLNDHKTKSLILN